MMGRGLALLLLLLIAAFSVARAPNPAQDSRREKLPRLNLPKLGQPLPAVPRATRGGGPSSEVTSLPPQSTAGPDSPRPSLFRDVPKVAAGAPKRFLFIDGNDDTNRMAVYERVLGDSFKQLDVVPLRHFDFDELKTRITKQYPLVFFTIHAANAGHPYPSAAAYGHKTGPVTLDLTKKVRTGAEAIKVTQDFNPLHLSSESMVDFNHDKVGAQGLYRIGVLKYLYNLVKTWNPRPVIVLLMCNQASERLAGERLQPPPAEPTGIEVFFPAAGCGSVRGSNAAAMSFAFTLPDRTPREIAEEFDWWYNMRHPEYSIKHADMAELLAVEIEDN